MPYDITLKAMRFDARVGILPHERAASQPIEVDVSVSVSESEAPTDIVDYRGLYDLVARVVAERHIDFLEEIVDRIALDTLAYSSRVRRVAVAVRKPLVSLGGPLAYAEVAIERSALRPQPPMTDA